MALPSAEILYLKAHEVGPSYDPVVCLARSKAEIHPVRGGKPCSSSRRHTGYWSLNTRLISPPRSPVRTYTNQDSDGRRGPSSRHRALESPQWSDFRSMGDFSFLGNARQRRLIEVSHDPHPKVCKSARVSPLQVIEKRSISTSKGESPWELAAERPLPRPGPVSAGSLGARLRRQKQARESSHRKGQPRRVFTWPVRIACTHIARHQVWAPCAQRRPFQRHHRRPSISNRQSPSPTSEAHGQITLETLVLGPTSVLLFSAWLQAEGEILVFAKEVGSGDFTK